MWPLVVALLPDFDELGRVKGGSSPNQMQPACAMNLSRSREERMG